MFRDAVEIFAHNDPKVAGITLHLSTMRRSLADRLKKDMWTDPTQVSVSATITAPIRILEPVSLAPEGQEVLTEKRNLFFKTLRVRRIYDPVAHCFVYVSYSTRFTQEMDESNSRYRTSISVVPLHDYVDPALFRSPNGKQ